MIKINALSLLVCLGLSGMAQTPVNPLVAEALQEKLDSCVNTFNLPGISASLILETGEVWNGASGVSDINTMEPFDTTHLLGQASVTKLLVATVVFQLIEEGLINLDDSVGMYLPPIETVPSNRKIRYLLNHRSGIHDFISAPGLGNIWYENPDSIWNPITAIETFNDDPIFNENMAFSYSNTNYVLLGLIVEAVTGNLFEVELRDRILDPYGLTQTFFIPAETVDGPLAKSWTTFTPGSSVYDIDASVIFNDCANSMVFTAGALVSYPKDMARFARLLFTGEILSEASLDIMKTCSNVNFSDGANGYGHGTMRYPFLGDTYFGHGGDVNGHTLLTIQEENGGVALSISINRDGAPRNPITVGLLTALQEGLISVGVNHDTNNTEYMQIYPNPSDGNFTVRNDFPDHAAGQIRIVVLSGNVVYEGDFSRDKEKQIDIRHLSSGLYIVQLVAGGMNSFRKLVIQ